MVKCTYSLYFKKNNVITNQEETMRRRFYALGLAAVLTASIVTGCGNKPADTTTAAATAVTAAETTAAAETTTAVKDMAGRDIQVPDEVKSVYSTSPVGTNFMYTFDDTMVAGTNFDLSDAEKKFTSDHYQSLPNLGGWYGKGNEGNVEEIIKAAPDLVLASGVDQSSIDTADQLQEKLGIPVVLINTDFDYMADAYRFDG